MSASLNTLFSGDIPDSIYSTTPNQLATPFGYSGVSSAGGTPPAVPAATAATATPAAPAAQPDQAPAISPMWGAFGGFDGFGSGGQKNPFAGAVPASTNPGFMTFAQAQAQAAMPGQNPFPFYDPSHPMWQLMFNQYTNMGATDPRLLFAQAGQGGGGGGGGGTG